MRQPKWMANLTPEDIEAAQRAYVKRAHYQEFLRLVFRSRALTERNQKLAEELKALRAEAWSRAGWKSE